MDPISLILAFALKNPQATAKLVDGYGRSGNVSSQNLQSSVADFAMQALSCYHKSARFRGVSILESPWRQQGMYGAQGSVVMRINFRGVTGTEYQMVVAAMAKDQAYRTFVIQENALVPYNKNCSLENWTEAAG